MEKYKRVEKQKPQEKIEENEIRITMQGKMRNYITYATNLLIEKKHSKINLRAMGRAINKTVTIAEIIKRRIPGLHQLTSIDSTDIVDMWEPIEEGLDTLETTRHVSSIQILLSLEKLDSSLVGYQEPLPESQVKPPNFNPGPSANRRGARGRGIRGRGFGYGFRGGWRGPPPPRRGFPGGFQGGFIDDRDFPNDRNLGPRGFYRGGRGGRGGPGFRGRGGRGGPGRGYGNRRPRFYDNDQ
eukprot:TRINITY_DN846_c0_g1_i2.p1 TRINITY_DN846_c0_g1~~TRINITY_DN846_c0_g1_i2.p1  ORF type:complete len:241 (-),score=47.92 TRINITY_DN846_c0_g1_i2:60-782(-)